MTDQLPATTGGPSALSLFEGTNDDFASMRQKDHLLPRATILQANSPDVSGGRYSAGTVMDSATKGEIIKPRTDGKYIIPLMYWLEWIEWNKKRNVPKEERIVAQSVDPQSKLAQRADKWEVYTNSEGREICTVTEYFNFLAIIIDPKYNDYDSVYLTGFARSSHRIGKMWLNRLIKARIEVEGQYIKAPMWAYRWAYKTEMVQKDGFSYYVPVIGDGIANPQQDWAQLKAIADGFKARRKEIMERNSAKEDDTEHEAATGGEPETAADAQRKSEL
jgi:hypothetical protein